MNKVSRGFILILTALLLVSIAACVIFPMLPGKNYTDDYRVFCEAKDITSTEALLDYCHDNNVEYEIKNGCFSMEDYDVQFTLDKSVCSIQRGSHCSKLAMLANNEYGFVTVTAQQNADGNLTETLSYKTLTHRYEFCEGQYRVITAWPAYVAFISAVILSFALVSYVKYCMACRREALANHNPNID